ncbi:hypothetical protein [Rufibacter sp. XAAS-G3-1]|uniref:hypothetical protein n=1 Tax=Rufibacter sp. XAAS-G3-1 TaxID=2729134 RepID=UPI0015E7DF2B|nr:hypothetical protein [Rufibacter sp. XAAS-G3-1]
MEAVLLFVAHGIDDSFLRACDRSLETVLAVCRFITPTFMSIALIISIGRGYLSGHGLQIDFSPIIKALALFLVLFFYQDLMNVLGAGIKGVTQLFDGSGNVGEALQKLTTPPGIAAAAQSDHVAQTDVVEQGGAWYSKIYNSIANFSLMNLITQFFTTTTVMLVRQIVLFIRQFVLGFLYVIGPIAICLSVIPAFSGLAGKWMQNFIAVQFWALTMNLLDLIYSNFADQNTAVGGVFGGMLTPGQGFNDVQFLLMSVAFIILYCMVPTLTGYFIGSTAVQGFLGAAVGVAAGAASTAAGVVAPPAAGGGVSGVLGRAMGFSNSGGGGAGSGSLGGETGSGSVFSGAAPAMPTSGGAGTSVRYNGSMATAAPAMASGGYAGGASRDTTYDSGFGTDSTAPYDAPDDGASALPSMGSSGFMRNSVRRRRENRKPPAWDEDDLDDIFID